MVVVVVVILCLVVARVPVTVVVAVIVFSGTVITYRLVTWPPFDVSRDSFGHYVRFAAKHLLGFCLKVRHCRVGRQYTDR